MADQPRPLVEIEADLEAEQAKIDAAFARRAELFTERAAAMQAQLPPEVQE